MPDDTATTRCRRLGHDVPLDYCRTQEGHTVCPLIRDCWWGRLDIDAYLREHLTEEEYERLCAGAPRTPRLSKIIEAAIKAAGGASGNPED